MLTEEIQNRVEKIKQNNIDGATTLTKETIQLFIDYLKKYSSSKGIIHRGELKKVVNLFANMQPSMAPIILFCNNLLILIDTVEEKRLYHYLLNYCMKSLLSIQQASEQINKYAKEIVTNKKKIVTYSSSKMIVDFLKYLKDSDKAFTIFCSESRPMNEGIKLAEECTTYGIDVTIMTDAALFSCLSEYDIVLLGADAISIGGLTNKIGSKVITILASRYKIPVYVLSLIEKILPIPYDIKSYQHHNPKEITDISNSYLTVENTYFDKSSLQNFTGFITQEGIFSLKDIKSYMNSIRIHESIKKILTNVSD